MANKTYHSFTDLAQAFRISPKEEQRTPRQRKCRVCGAIMHSISGTNVAVCTGTIKGEDGKIKDCNNRAISAIYPAKEAILV